MHLLKCRGGDHVGDWVIEKAGSSSLGGGLVQRVAIGPTDRAGFRNGLKGPQLFGPKSDPDRMTGAQKVMGGMKVRKEAQLTGAHTDKACFGQSGPLLLGPNQTESVKSPKAQKQVQRGFGRQNWGLKAVSLGPKVDLICFEVETRREDEGVRPGEKGSSHSDPLVDLAWICAKGPLLDAHEERTGLMDCDRFESCGKEGLWEMSYVRPLLISSCQGPTENGYPAGQALELVEQGFRGSEVEVAEDQRSRTFGSRYETVSSSICSSPLCSVFGRPLLFGGPSDLGDYHGHEDMGDIELLRVVSADGIEWGEKTSEDITDVVLETEGCGEISEEGPKTRSECLGYENWEDNCLIKFSEFLGIPTLGYDVEILELLRKMVS